MIYESRRQIEKGEIKTIYLKERKLTQKDAQNIVLKILPE